MTEELKQLLEAVKNGELEKAQELAEQLEPPEHRNKEIQEMLAIYSYLTGVVFEKDYTKHKNYNEILEFCNKYIKRSSSYKEIYAEVHSIIDLLSDFGITGWVMLGLYILTVYRGQVITEVVLPHLQELGLYPLIPNICDS